MEVKPENRFLAYWRKMGGGSLTLSIAIHAILLAVALFVVWEQITREPPPVEFLSGGGGGTEGNTKINEKRRQMMVNRAPSVRIASSVAGGSVVLPDTSSSMVSMSTLSAAGGKMSGSPGSGGGWGGGKGGGTGTGTGIGSGLGRGGGFTAKFLGLTTTGNNIIFCIDTSGSMRGNLGEGGIAALRKELQRAIDSLPATAMFNIICFGQSGDIFKAQSVAASAGAKQEAMEFMKGYFEAGGFRTRTETYGTSGQGPDGISWVPLRPGDVKELAGTTGGSRIDLAMVAAFERQPSTLFVLSDGAPGTTRQGEGRPMDKKALIDFIHEKYKKLMPGQPLTVSTISVETSGAEGREGAEFLRNLARKFGGKHKEIRPARL